MHDTLTRLRQRLDRLEPSKHQRNRKRIALGCEAVDGALGGGLAAGVLHETVSPRGSDGAAAAGFAAAVVQRAGTRPLVWIRDRMAEVEGGALYAPGLAEMGLDPARVTLVRARHPRDLLAAALEAVRCPALGAVVVEAWGRSPLLDLTATRRLMLAAENSGVTALLLRVGTEAERSAAFTRWRVGAARSQALAANAPGLATFDITLLRNRAGTSGLGWRVEWDHGQQHFRSAAPLSRGVVPLPQRRPARPQRLPLARTG